MAALAAGPAAQDRVTEQGLNHRHPHPHQGAAHSDPVNAKRRRLCHGRPACTEVDTMLSWASAADLRAGWDLYSKLRVYGLCPSDAALRPAHPDSRPPGPAVQHYRFASDLVRSGILQTLEQRWLERLSHASKFTEECCTAAFAEEGEVTVQGAANSVLSPTESHTTPPTGRSNWASLPVDVMLQIVGRLESKDLHKAACISAMYKDVIGCVMQSLNFSWCHHHSPRLEINQVVRGASVIFNQLESISLRRQSGLEDSSLCMLVASNPGKLKSIDLNGCGGLSDASLNAIALHCRGLECLDVSSCTKMTASGFVRLAKACPDLRSLNACGCELLTDMGLMALAIHCKY